MKAFDKKTARKKLYRALFLLIVVLVSKYVSDTYFQVMLIHGDSMEPSYHNMQFVLIDKRVQTVHTGDVVAFRCEGLHAILVKRVVAESGQTAVIRGGRLFVAGKESTLYEGTIFSYAGILSKEIVLAVGEYIVIGDNTEESKDSRYECVGIIQENDIIGRVV